MKSKYLNAAIILLSILFHLVQPLSLSNTSLTVPQETNKYSNGFLTTKSNLEYLKSGSKQIILSKQGQILFMRRLSDEYVAIGIISKEPSIYFIKFDHQTNTISLIGKITPKFSNLSEGKGVCDDAKLDSSKRIVFIVCYNPLSKKLPFSTIVVQEHSFPDLKIISRSNLNRAIGDGVAGRLKLLLLENTVKGEIQYQLFVYHSFFFLVRNLSTLKLLPLLFILSQISNIFTSLVYAFIWKKRKRTNLVDAEYQRCLKFLITISWLLYLPKQTVCHRKTIR